MKKSVVSILFLVTSICHGEVINLDCQGSIFSFSNFPDSVPSKVMKDNQDFDGLDNTYKLWVYKLEKLKITNSMIEVEMSEKIPPPKKSNHKTTTYYSINRLTGFMYIRTDTTFFDTGKISTKNYGPIKCLSVKQRF